MKKKISLVVTDVDGTLVKMDKTLTPRAIAAVQRLHDNDIAFSLCSSRPPFGLRHMISALGVKVPLGGYNGGAIVEPDMTLIEQKVIPQPIAEKAVQIFQQNQIDCWVFVGNEWNIANPDGDHVDLETYTIQTPPTLTKGFAGVDFGQVGKLVGPSKDHDKINRVTALLQGELAGQAHAARSQPYYCDVTPHGIDKGRLVEVLGERLGIPRDEIMVLGDAENDIGLFRKAGFSVAMGNATDEVKRMASAITLKNDDDGWAAAIDKFIFGEE